MAIKLVTGPANAGKARVAMAALRGHLARGQDPILIVPTRADVDHYRLELARGGRAMGVRVQRFDGLIGEVMGRSGGVFSAAIAGGAAPGPGADGKLVRGTAREHLLRVAAGRAWPGVGTAAGPGLVRALRSLVEEIYARRITVARLRAASGPPPGDARGGGIAGLLEAYEEILAEAGRVDPAAAAIAAIDRLRSMPALWRGTPVVLYGFDDLTALQLEVVDALGVAVDAAVTVALSYEPGRVAFAGRAGTGQRLIAICADHEHLQARSEHYAPDSRDALHHLERNLFEADPPPRRAHPRGAVRLLEGGGERAEIELVARDVRALLDGGMEAAEIAVVHRAPGTVADLIGDAFDALGIPHAVRRPLTFAQTASGRALMGLIAAACGGLAGIEEGTGQDLIAWLRAPGLLRRPELADRLEVLARREGAATASATRLLWEDDHWPLRTLDRLRAAASTGPVELIDACEQELERIFCAPRAGEAAVLGREDRIEAGALARARVALGELRELAAVDPAIGPDVGQLARVLAELDVTGRDATAGGDPPGGRVAVVAPPALRARRVKALFLCGLQEGVFPASVPPEVLLDERERALVDAAGIGLPGGDRSLGMERYLMYATVSRPEEVLCLSWHVETDDGRATPRSLFVDDVCDLFDESLIDDRGRRALGAISPGRVGGLPSVGIRDGGLAQGAALTRDALDEEQLSAVVPKVWSPSSLESWAACPIRWLIERRLRARGLEPEAEPLTRGSIAHEALRLTRERLRERTGSARIDRATVALARELIVEALEELTAEQPLSVHPERVPGVTRRLTRNLQRYVEAAAIQDGPLEPAHLELCFGGVGGQDAPPLDLGEGVLVRGRIDRVDVAGDGRAIVYDYKSSVAVPGARWVTDRSLQVAIYMRAVSQTLGCDVVGGLYQPLSGPDLRPRGAVRGEVGLDGAIFANDVYDDGPFAAVVEGAIETARQAGVEARQGRLVGRPDSCGYRGEGCRYPTICRCGDRS